MRMRARIIQRPNSGSGGCTLFGRHFSEQCVKGLDAGLVSCFCYMVIFEASDYNKYQNKGGCTKPFGLFWIGHFTSIVLFRVFHYLEKYSKYRLALIIVLRDNTRLRRALIKAYTMIVCKLLAYCGFVAFTIIGSVWFVQDGRCLNKFEETTNNLAQIKMAFWLFVSFTLCLIYAIKVFTRQIFERTSTELREVDDNALFDLFLWADQVEHRGGRSLTEREINSIKKSKLNCYDELSRFAKESLRQSQQLNHGASPMVAVVADEPVAVNGDFAEAIDESELKQDESERLQVTCAICLEDIEIGEWFKKLPECKHCFHATCIDQWLSTRATCPVCRKEIFLDEDVLQSSVTDELYPPIQTSSSNVSDFIIFPLTGITS